MADVKSKIIIDKLNFPVDGYEYDVKVLRSVDGGKNFYYCGCGEFAKTEEDAKEIREKLAKKEVCVVE